MVSADASFLVSCPLFVDSLRSSLHPQDFSAPMTLDLVVQPVQIVVGMGLLIYTLGYSALVGLAVSPSMPIYLITTSTSVLTHD
jgi:hypothetical protein